MLNMHMFHIDMSKGSINNVAAEFHAPCKYSEYSGKIDILLYTSW